ncbi:MULTISPECIES: flavodoxin family protein [Streptomyces]|uniref:Flavodoxin family protein n=1 Tax=Streptomyces albidocamelliae TaxID=2981135 RepID=A0ABY6EYQ1_9ACTN|nr:MULTISPECIES: flavodoxin family protein [unclassified Streptomyces]PKW12093.1 multimeric flavodoxin WrbA [Streptomyces sp. 5112.2]UXY39547.1 flavodoxin family protein [Streptomyces sp. HUAS 14-6]SEB62848.1 Multimeric flavodoxin WrbA [Streptomyces sp. 1222.5]SEE30327.1 Multimeric flavodoxin WrbA [Streptomyces sp. 2231.1]
MSENPVSVAIAYHSGYGHTTRMAEGVEEGIRSVAGAAVEVVKVDGITEEDWARLDAADAIIFGSPTYMGSASPAFHTFAAATSGRWYGLAWKDKVAAGFTTSGAMSGDKLNTLQYFTVLAAQHGMHWVNLDLLPGDTENDLNRLGGWLGAMGQCPGDQGAESMRKGDLLTAAHLGRRVAEHALLLRTARERTAA